MIGGRGRIISGGDAMATYDSLTPEQKSHLATLDTFARSFVSSIVQAANAGNASGVHQFSVDTVDPILSTLDATEVIPNSTNLQGAQDLTVTEFTALRDILRGLLTTQQTNVSLLTKAAGVRE